MIIRRTRFTIAALSVLTLTSPLFAQGWESLNQAQLIGRSRYIGVGRLILKGRAVDGWREGTIIFSKTIYTGVGDTKSLTVRVPVKTVPGTKQAWPDQKKGIWFILKVGDKYEPINHPSCWVDERKAKSAANQVYQWANQLYSEAQEAASQSSDEDGDSEESQSNYEKMASAAQAASSVPFQDSGQQSSNLFQQATQMLETAGVKSPFPSNLKDSKQQQQFFNQFKQMLGPIGDKLGSFSAGKMNMAQNGMGQMIVELVRNTMGSANPSKALQNMSPIKLPMEQSGRAGGSSRPGSGGPFGPPSGGPFGGASKGPSSINLPMNMFKNISKTGSRKNMLQSGIGKLGGGMKKPGFPGSGRPGPGGGRPGPGGGPPRR